MLKVNPPAHKPTPATFVDKHSMLRVAGIYRPKNLEGIYIVSYGDNKNGIYFDKSAEYIEALEVRDWDTTVFEKLDADLDFKVRRY